MACTYRATGAAAKPADPPSGSGVPATGTVTVTLTFSQGPVQITMDRAAAPCTVHSFESLAQQGFYNGSACHRLGTTGAFFLQCGDPSGSGTGGPGYTFDDELAQTSSYTTGVVAMANSGANTNGSQFFLVYADSPFPPSYTIFGHMDNKSSAVVAGVAMLGQDGSWKDGTGRPVGDATIKTASAG